MSIPTITPKLPRTNRDWPTAGLDVASLREDFPILGQKTYGKPLVYLDNAATTQKPRAVLDALQRYYTEDNANVHRGVHRLSQQATQEFEAARSKVRQFLNAASTREIIFVRGTTEAINLVAQTYGRKNLNVGDEIIISHLEHHSNIVPWQMLCEEKNAVLRVIPINERGELLLDAFEKLLSPRTKLVAVTYVSNALGTVNPIRQIIDIAHRRGIPVLIDGAQAVAHLPVDVQQFHCDFFAFSGHKMYGPTGIGVLYGKEKLLEAMPPYMGGGDMISSVTFAKTSYADLPNKFEAGTPHIAGAIGLAAAIDYVQAVGRESTAAYEQQLLHYATECLQQIPGVRILGTSSEKIGVISFVVNDPPLSALDIGTQLDLEGIAVRTGHHCCQPVMDRFQVPGTVRLSFAMYNTVEEVDRLVTVLRTIVSQATAKVQAVLETPVSSEPAYSKAVASSPQAAADELVEAFDFMDSWTDRYQYLIELGDKLPLMPTELKTEANRIHGCQSIVFLHARWQPGTTDTLEFLADSDADIVRGLIGLLQRVYVGQKADQVLAFDVESFFHRLDLDQHLSLTRRNGLAAMVKHIRRFAATRVAANGATT